MKRAATIGSLACYGTATAFLALAIQHDYKAAAWVLVGHLAAIVVTAKSAPIRET